MVKIYYIEDEKKMYVQVVAKNGMMLSSTKNLSRAKSHPMSVFDAVQKFYNPPKKTKSVGMAAGLADEEESKPSRDLKFGYESI